MLALAPYLYQIFVLKIPAVAPEMRLAEVPFWWIDEVFEQEMKD